MIKAKTVTYEFTKEEIHKLLVKEIQESDDDGRPFGDCVWSSDFVIKMMNQDPLDRGPDVPTCDRIVVTRRSKP